MLMLYGILIVPFLVCSFADPIYCYGNNPFYITAVVQENQCNVSGHICIYHFYIFHQEIINLYPSTFL